MPLPVLDALPQGAHRLFALTDDALFASCGVRIAFTTRDGGVSGGCYASLNLGDRVGDDPDAVRRNRSLVLQAIGADRASLISLKQVHGTDSLRVSDASRIDELRSLAQEGADMIVVDVENLAACLCSADCLLVIVVSPSGRFAIAHAGWRGALGGIAGKAVRELAESDAFPASSYNAYIGPHICPKCFEVGSDLAERFLDAFGDEAVPDSCHVSLARSVVIDLKRAGMDERRIADADACTKCEPERYFSYRASGGQCGRQSAIACRIG